jgi:hypothetical protein
MTKRPKRPRDPNQLARHAVELATGENVRRALQARHRRQSRTQTEGQKAGIWSSPCSIARLAISFQPPLASFVMMACISAG